MAVVTVEQLLGVDCDEEAEKHYRWVQGDCVCGKVEVWCEGEEVWRLTNPSARGGSASRCCECPLPLHAVPPSLSPWCASPVRSHPCQIEIAAQCKYGRSSRRSVPPCLPPLLCPVGQPPHRPSDAPIIRAEITAREGSRQPVLVPNSGPDSPLFYALLEAGINASCACGGDGRRRTF